MAEKPEQTPPVVQLMQFITGHWVAAAVHAAAKLKLADHLKNSSKGSDVLAKELGVNASSLYRVMRSLACLGVLKEGEHKDFSLTEVGDLLRSDHPQSMRAMALFQGAPPHWKGWGNFLYSVKTGKSAFENAHGLGFFEYCQKDTEFGEYFNMAMTGFSAAAAEAVNKAYDFAGIRKLADVGGGHGLLLASILQRYPQMHGAIADLPHVVSGAKPALEAAKVANRVELVGGSFFDAVPAADAYIAKNIIHDWDDEHSIKLLTNMKKAMQGKGKVLLVELMIGKDERQLMPTLLDLEMLHATHGGRERTEAEFARLFAESGLKLNRVLPTESLFTIIEAVPA